MDGARQYGGCPNDDRCIVSQPDGDHELHVLFKVEGLTESRFGPVGLLLTDDDHQDWGLFAERSLIGERGAPKY